MHRTGRLPMRAQHFWNSNGVVHSHSLRCSWSRRPRSTELARWPKPTAQRIRQGGSVQAALLVNKVQPVYPPLARQTRISGTVRLHALISKSGSVESLEVISGHPLLVRSAMDAVQQWKYKPTLLNGEPVEVDTTIDVIFSLNQ